MDVHKSSLLAVFDAKQRLEVPLFQRQYVWNEEQQWLPLWEDIERKFTEKLEGREDAPNHFLGAMVLDQKQTPTGHVVVRLVIDGQQRLTTLQIFLSAYRDFCREQNCEALAEECDKFLFNTGIMADPDIDKYKVWPTQLDRQQFTDVVSAQSREEMLRRYPLRKKKYARKYDPRPRMVESYFFFYSKLKYFFFGEEGEEPIAVEHPISTRADECFQTLRNSLMVVVIDLQKEDDPQVIFEALNARGEPLLPADLLRNYIFFRANRDKLDVEAVYEKYWRRFDDEFWRTEVKQGRLNRPRSDLFMQHFLASWQGQDIPIKHLYVEYRHWLERTNPFPSVTAELAALAAQGDHFRRIVDPQEDDVIFELANFLEAFDVRTAYPLLLALFYAETSDEEWKEFSEILESYLLRRAICDLGTKNYNKIFLALTRNLRKAGFRPAKLKQLLLAQAGESGAWPSDAVFKDAWLNKKQYGPLNSPKLIHIFKRLNQTFISAKSEKLSFEQKPTIEHIMPQSWVEHWPLPDGRKGMEYLDILMASEDDPQALASQKREFALQTMGNLTILSTELNSGQGKLPWKQKKPEMMKHSLLPINQTLFENKKWNEVDIAKRGEELFDRALSVWKRD